MLELIFWSIVVVLWLIAAFVVTLVVSLVLGMIRSRRPSSHSHWFLRGHCIICGVSR